MKVEIVVQERVTRPAELSGTWAAVVFVYGGVTSSRIMAMFNTMEDARDQCAAWMTAGINCRCVTVEIPS